MTLTHIPRRPPLPHSRNRELIHEGVSYSSRRFCCCRGRSWLLNSRNSSIGILPGQLAVKKTTQSSVQVRIRLTIQARLGSLDEVSLALCECSYLQQFCTPRVT